MVDEKPKTKSNKAKSAAASVKKETDVPDDSDFLKPVKVKKEAQKTKTEDVKPKITPKAVKVKDEEVDNLVESVKSKKKAQHDIDSKKNKTQDDATDKKPKKVYALAGQKHDPPQERDPLRIFYESLYEQRPSSEMAAIWMMEHGLLPAEEAKKTLEKKQKKQPQPKVGTPVKSSSTKKDSEKNKATKDHSKVSSKSKKKAASHSDSDSDDDLIKPKKKLKMSS